ncbi:thioredoxin-disulfide reductase [Patescibacteria group bacterium]|nr:thioredoxin-disulfide reductase [Patescibacteria group bacterium]
MEEKSVYDSVIIGSGPAGLTAAIYQIRANLKTVVIAGNQPGGQLTITTLVDNYPGFPTGIGGVKLMMDMQTQVRNLGVEIKQGLVQTIEKAEGNGGFRVILTDGTALASKTVIVGTGAQARWLGIPGEKELLGKGVSGCATCDGMFFRNKVITVVGGGDTACEEAVFLSRFGSEVRLLHRRETLRATQTEQKRLLETPKVKIMWNTEVKEVIGKDKVESIKIFNNQTNEESTMATDGLFVAIGRVPETAFVKDVVELKEQGHIKTKIDPRFPTMTSVPGIFAAGDCVDETYRQAIVAAGEGCKAALDAERWMMEQ